MDSGVLWKGSLIIVAVRFGKSPGFLYNFFLGLANWESGKVLHNINSE